VCVQCLMNHVLPHCEQASFSILKTKRLMLFGEIIALCSGNYTGYTNTLSGNFAKCFCF